ncbi:hypothetical protein BDV10DRAFT_163553 [Aspergillus recurvatus]
MSDQSTFYSTDLALDSLIATESLLMDNEFSPDFFTLAMLDREGQSMFMQFPPNQPQPQPATQSAPLASGESGEMNGPRLRNRTLRSAPRNPQETQEALIMDPDMDRVPFIRHSYPSIRSSGSFPSNSTATTADYDADGHFDQDCVSPYSDHNSNISNKTSSPLRWHTGHNQADSEKRAKHLERNRAAASKSRWKKKRETDQLRKQFEEASQRKSGLEVEIKELRTQLLSLKDQVLLHSLCDDEAIHLYMGRMVKQVTRHDWVSSASTNKPDKERERSRAGSVSPSHSRSDRHGHVHSQPDSELESSTKQGLLHMGDAVLPCDVKEPRIYHQPRGNIFDLQLSAG